MIFPNQREIVLWTKQIHTYLSAMFVFRNERQLKLVAYIFMLHIYAKVNLYFKGKHLELRIAGFKVMLWENDFDTAC